MLLRSAEPVAEPLPALGLPAGVTVSGLSSGGYMAAQFAVAYSASVDGVGVVQGGPYDCAQGHALVATTQCSCLPGGVCKPLNPAVQAPLSWQRATGQAAAGQIDDTAQLQRQRVWLFSGGQDHTVPAANVATVAAFYRGQAHLPASRLRWRRDARAGHGLPVSPPPDDAVGCGLSASPFLTDCGRDVAHELLDWLYPGRLPAQPAEGGRLLAFDQRPHTAGRGHTGLADSGYLFVPDACAARGAGCALHVVFHGCSQASGSLDAQGQPMGDRFAREAGYNRWAAAARLVLLYPQVAPLDTGAPQWVYRHNPAACWDFWGYTQPWTGWALSRYATQQAPQMQAVRSMIEALQR